MTSLNMVNDLIEKAKEHGWIVNNKRENNYSFSRISSAGQKFSFDILIDKENLKNVIKNIQTIYENFDVSKLVYSHLDETGHGKNGAPYEMIDVLKDMQACVDKIYYLYSALNRWYDSCMNIA